LQDLENTTGSWDMYGQDDAKRYPGMQNEFFNNVGDILRRREALRGFVALCEWQLQQQPWHLCEPPSLSSVGVERSREGGGETECRQQAVHSFNCAQLLKHT
jgi:hypothetical protein